jgi:hypothetical protein
LPSIYPGFTRTRSKPFYLELIIVRAVGNCCSSPMGSAAMDEVSEDQCLICRNWPQAERPDRRLEHFTKGGLLLIPRHDICPACEHVFRVTKTRH